MSLLTPLRHGSWTQAARVQGTAPRPQGPQQQRASTVACRFKDPGMADAAAVAHTERAIAHLRSELQEYSAAAEAACAEGGDQSKACVVRVAGHPAAAAGWRGRARAGAGAIAADARTRAARRQC